MEQKKYGKLPPPKDDVVAWNAKRRELYIEGIKYLYGQGGKDENVETAYQLIKQSADMNFPYAISSIGMFYSTGKVVTQDYEKSFNIFQEMFERLNPAAAFNLGVVYKEGLGVAANFEEAKCYFAWSVAYAAREICQGEELGRTFLKDAFSFSDGHIETIILIYKNKPLCEFCHGFLPCESDEDYLRNKISFFEVKSELFNMTDNKKYSRGEPVLKNGYCCSACEHSFVDPIRKALEAKTISIEEVKLLHIRDDMINAIKIFKKAD